jgi:hypothetical protein
MIDFRVMRMATGESFLCIVKQETEKDITVLFPLLITKQTFQVAQNVMREVHSTSSFCPFTDDKEFTFSKKELTFIKPMNKDAVPYYVDMLNKQEEPEALKSYDLEELVKPENFLEISDIVDEKMEQLMKKMEEIQEETEGQVKVDSNKTLH